MDKRDVQRFAARLEDNLFALNEALKNGTYEHDVYEHFYVYDPKRRYISKATVRDRIIHQAVAQVIEPLFERQFIFDSYASRKGKGTHAAVERLELFLRQATKNYRYTVYVLKCDIKRFFDSIHHEELLSILKRTISDQKLLCLIEKIVESYSVGQKNRGLPLGNVTSQLFTNIYLNRFDRFVKERLRLRWYLRFCDDFVIVHPDRSVLKRVIPHIRTFLLQERFLILHPDKTSLRKLSYGVDFVGQILRSYYRVLRTKTKRRLFRRMDLQVAEYRAGRISTETLRSSFQSCLGILSHGANYRARKKLFEEVRRRLLFSCQNLFHGFFD